MRLLRRLAKYCKSIATRTTRDHLLSPGSPYTRSPERFRDYNEGSDDSLDSRTESMIEEEAFGQWLTLEVAAMRPRGSVTREGELTYDDISRDARKVWLQNIKKALSDCKRQFCRSCSTVDFENCFSPGWEHTYVIQPQSQTEPIHPHRQPCQLCEMIKEQGAISRLCIRVDCAPKALREAANTDLSLDVSFYADVTIDETETQPWYSTHKKVEIMRATNFYPRWFNQSTSVTFDLILNHLDHCRTHHGRCEDQKRQVDNLRVINCEDRRIVDAPASCTYVALSYVWGVVPRMNAVNDQLPDVMHATLEDALAVAQ